MDLVYRILTCCSQLLNLGFSCIFLSTALEPELRKSNVNQFQLCGHFAIELEDCIDARGIFFTRGVPLTSEFRTCPKEADAIGAGEISSKISPTGLAELNANRSQMELDVVLQMTNPCGCAVKNRK
jgi:hypothetical protein